MTRRWISTKVIYGPDGRKLIDDGFWYDGPLSLAVDMATFQNTDFAFYNDDGSESGATIIGSVGNQQSLLVDTVFHCRIQVEETLGVSGNFNGVAWQYNNVTQSTGLVDITTTSSHIKVVTTANLTDGNDTTGRIQSSPFETPNAWVTNDGAIPNLSYAASSSCETVMAFEIVGADVNDADNILISIDPAATANPADIDVDKPAGGGRRFMWTG